MGIMILKKIFLSDMPRVLAASVILRSTCSKAPRQVLYIMGKDTAAAAMTAPCHVNSTLNPADAKAPPIGLFLPKIISKKKPTTVGGSTIGNENSPSARLFPLFMEITSLAAAMPKTKVIRVAKNATLKDIHRGERSFITAP